MKDNLDKQSLQYVNTNPNTQENMLRKYIGTLHCIGNLQQQHMFLSSEHLSRKQFLCHWKLLFILKFNVNVTIPIPNIEECGPRLVKTSDWSDHHISASDWLIDMLNASRQDQKSFLTGTMLQKENSNANSTQSILDWLVTGCIKIATETRNKTW